MSVLLSIFLFSCQNGKEQLEKLTFDNVSDKLVLSGTTAEEFVEKLDERLTIRKCI